jgi:hypothetical protein
MAGDESGGTFEPIGSTRVNLPGTVLCKCVDPSHVNHESSDRCGELVFKDGYCRECYKLRGGSIAGDD